jgi:hypothetical protein
MFNDLESKLKTQYAPILMIKFKNMENYLFCLRRLMAFDMLINFNHKNENGYVSLNREEKLIFVAL